MTTATAAPASDPGADTGAPTDGATLHERLDRLVADAPLAATDPAGFRGRQFDLGLAWIHFPVGHGGLGLDPQHQLVIDERLDAAGVGSNFLDNPIGMGMCAPTIVTHGTEVQRERYLRRIFTAEDVWCQLFSEPGAGSDVASASTRARLDGDVWTVDGQKVWTSLGHVARLGLLLARTDPDVPKHRGITCFVVDMHGAGVDVRPLRQLTGDAEFNEVYFEGVQIPDGDRIGDVGNGWRVGITTLMNERVAIGGQTPPRGSGPIAEAVDLWHDDASRQTATVRDSLMRLWIEAEVIRLTNIRAQQSRRTGDPGPEGSISKLAQCEFNQRCTSFCVDLLGPEGMLYETGYAPRPLEAALSGYSEGTRAFLRARGNTIEGGTSEIMRNILGERVLGLPGDVRIDRDVAFNAVPRS